MRAPVAVGLGAALALACADPTIPGRAGVYSFADTFVVGLDTTVDLFHWPVTRLPVRFWADTRGNMRALVARGVAAWADQFLYQEFRGVLVDDSTQADVIVTWTDSVPPDVPPDPGAPEFVCGGLTTIEFDSASAALAGPILVSLTVLNLDPPATAAQVQACMRRVAVHELGHALGLLRHSPFDEDLMYGAPLVDYPSRFDRRTVEVLYHSTPTVGPPP